VIGALLAAAGALAAPPLSSLAVTDGATPFAGDRPLLATISPNGDGFRDRAVVRFRLTRPATVRMEVVRTEQAGELGSTSVIWTTNARLPRGPAQLVWRPARGTPPRTYVLRLTVTDGRGRTRVYGGRGPGRRQDAPVVRVQGVDAVFTRRSYAPGEAAEIVVSCDAAALSLQVFAYSGGAFPSPQQDVRTNGVAVSGSVPVDWRAHRNRPTLLRVVRAGNWRSGLYFLRLRAADGRVGYAPFVVRPRRLGEHRVAVVLATYTWQAYNFADANGDGWGDSWYVGGTPAIDLARPFLDFGIPFRFHDWDLTFLTWLEQTGKQVDVIADDDLDAVASGDALAKAYDLIVFPGHEEYVTRHMADVVERYRDLGGNLAFLAANNFFWQVRRTGTSLTKAGLWRDLGRPEARLVGVQYVGSNHGATQGPFVVAPSAPEWLLAGTGLAAGNSFGRYGIEIDARSAASPPGTLLLASIPDVLGPGLTAEMTYYESAAGAKVFAAGALNFASSAGTPPVSGLLENLWTRLSRP
jgi:hypothetical protein